jgi:cystathionine beta-lyase/cystathionine gamma-synthase
MTQSRVATTCIHGSAPADPAYGAVVAPIYQTATFVQPEVGVDRGYTYSRTHNPTVSDLERALGALEGALPAACFATGMAAITALILATAEAGDEVLVGDVVYGGTARLLRQVLGKFGVRSTFVDAGDLAAVARSLERGPALALFETPANPTLKLTDIAGVARLCRAAGVRLAIDNTFLTPVLQRPLDLGADVCVYSTTKYLEGHDSTVGGALLTRDGALLDAVRFVQNAVGFGASPFDAFLTRRGLETLPLRLAAHCANAGIVARFLESHAEVDAVAWPGLESFPQRALAERQQAGPGGMLAFTLRGGVPACHALLRSTRLARLAESLGGTHTLLTHPATMTHAAVPAEERARLGIGDGLIRLSVGLEDPEDLLADLAAALGGGR